jgi:hypothetical protein
LAAHSGEIFSRSEAEKHHLSYGRFSVAQESLATAKIRDHLTACSDLCTGHKGNAGMGRDFSGGLKSGI